MLPAIPGSATACLTRWIGFGFGQRLVLAQPAENIFHVDNRIIHHFTQRDDHSAERNGVNRNAKLLQDDDAVSRDNGMAVNEIQAVLTLPSRKNRTTATRNAPSARECFMLRRAVSINVAGRCKRG